ncbi:nucleotidyltransferase domain-containing protein [Calothrix sp. 336/3]|uniref:nucleotidyltransferase domain-containing protein n=1 Tax=Calothrix sp. 336/3 TaxID=1337936 RepID=UPI0004E3CFF1|nr:nucleotidyltransferase family protein [Calothrix sp. 336/3]AKG20942.1 hypothetical protein IJ00_06200 [Calothrix sp. 336/3]
MKTLSKSNFKHNYIHLNSTNQIILTFGRKELYDEEKEYIHHLIQDNSLDWQVIISKAYNHGLIPLLYTHLNNFNKIANINIPQDVYNQLRDLFYNNAQRSLRLTAELITLLKLLQAQNIPAIPYKGAALANLLYGNVSLRQFCDIDIIVQPQDILKFKQILISQGYEPQVSLTAKEERQYLQDKSKHTYNFIHHQKQIMVEVHWRITPQYTSPLASPYIWQNLEFIKMGGIEVPTFSAENWLLFLCAHGSRHRWEKLCWLADIGELIRQNPGISWQKIIQTATEFDCRRILFVGLFLTHSLIGISLPQEVWQSITEDKEVAILASEICQDLLDEKKHHHKIMQNTFYYMRVREHLKNKLLYLELFLRWLMRDKGVLMDD